VLVSGLKMQIVRDWIFVTVLMVGLGFVLDVDC